ncbi:DUF6691 family protein [Chitinolyticbacter meiyuanensis]|uniref:DUF6691 family protein n=1 Tax=Chitinolyticbacter meiyuanensis TaxID=682798 RepID=UPI0011E59BD5|nr:DUF6691 family protein [Chitinolyticbacter meiyuanensis]
MLPLISFAAGLIFGAGLIVSGMANPTKVLGFLDLAGAWDPSLALVIGGAIASASGLFAWAQRRSTTLLTAEPMQLPASRTIDRRLLLGSVLFGAGWGLAGICPGPALVGLIFDPLGFAPFMLAMLAGFWLFGRWERRRG